ncbi:MAG TPA: hypothetical protein VGD95_05540 [Micavibrio sp.]
MTSLSESRFHMWRAVFALAHADGHVSEEERRFMEIYLSRLSLTDAQHQLLRADITQAQDVAHMFASITVEKDVEDFFNFARLLVWCDGDFDEQEKRIMEMLRKRQDTPLGAERLLLKLQNSGRKKSDWLKKARHSIHNLKDVLDMFVAMGESDLKGARTAQALEESRFYMWRAVFAMAHADDVVTAEELKYLKGILAREPFSAEQKKILEDDIEHAQDIAEMYLKIEDQNDRSQFFYHARMLVWSDGDFGEQEQKIMMRLKHNHVRTVDFDQLIKDMDLSLDDDQKARIVRDHDRVVDDTSRTGLWGKLMRLLGGR